MRSVAVAVCAAALCSALPSAGASSPEGPAPVRTIHPADLPAGAEEPLERSPFTHRRPVRGATAGTRLAGPGAAGTAFVPVLLADFSDNAAETEIHTPAAYQALLFERGHAAGAGSLRDYYLDQSGGLLDVTGTVTPWLRMPRPYSSYVGSSYGYQMSTPNDWTLVEDAVAAADPHVDFCAADADANGEVDTIFVVHAGPGAEEVGSGLWSVQWRLPSPYTTADKCSDGRTMKVSTFTIQPEEYADARYSAPGSPDRLIGVGMFAHEFGHVLGLPDLYDTDYSSPGGVGPWDVMASGAWGFYGARPWRPTPLSAWSKAELGWAAPVNVEANMHGVSIPSSDAAHTGIATGVYRLAPDASPDAGEYFLVENRTAEGWAADFPAGGLAVWHVHSSAAGNADDSNRLVELVQADGRGDLLTGSWGRGDAGDLFPGSSGVTLLTGTGQPNTLLRSGADSFVEVRNIGLPGPSTTADLLVAPDTTAGSSGDPAAEPASESQRWSPTAAVTLHGRRRGSAAKAAEADGRFVRLRSRRRGGRHVLDYFFVLEAAETPAALDRVRVPVTVGRRLRGRVRVLDPDGGWVAAGRIRIPASSRRSFDVPDPARLAAGGRVVVRITTARPQAVRHHIDRVVAVAG